MDPHEPGTSYLTIAARGRFSKSCKATAGRRMGWQDNMAHLLQSFNFGILCNDGSWVEHGERRRSSILQIPTPGRRIICSITVGLIVACTRLIMTLLLWSFVVVEGKNKMKRRKQRARRKRQGCSLARLAIAERALNDPRNLTSPQLNYSDSSKTTLKITTKNREANNDKIGHKNLSCAASTQKAQERSSNTGPGQGRAFAVP
jgi:hypothetical protein